MVAVGKVMQQGPSNTTRADKAVEGVGIALFLIGCTVFNIGLYLVIGMPGVLMACGVFGALLGGALLQKK